ncbi:MAG: hypothetical protein CM1200mP11_2230 [Nitrosopumilaceae archaeon]|nr:MAG: hypothetical protein CM1200mP11_2230 [Nitrosopumilaceae archaeon]
MIKNMNVWFYLLKPYLSPVHVGILSLVKKDGLKEKTDEIFLGIKRKK